MSFPMNVQEMGNISGAIVLDAAKGNYFRGTLTGDITASIRNVRPGMPFYFEVLQSGGGGWLVSFAGSAQTVLAPDTGVPPIATTGTSFFQFAGSKNDETTVALLSSGSGTVPAFLSQRIDLTDANVALSVADGQWFDMPAATQTATRTVRLDGTGSPDDQIIRISDYDFGAFGLIVRDDLTSAVLYTFAANAGGDAYFQFNAGTGSFAFLEGYAESAAKNNNALVLRDGAGSAAFNIVTADTLSLTRNAPAINASQALAGAGQPLIVTAQLGGTPGTDQAGAIDFEMGALTAAGTTGARIFYDTAGTHRWYWEYVSEARWVSGNGLRLLTGNGAGTGLLGFDCAQIVEATANVPWKLTTLAAAYVVAWQAGVTTITETLPAGVFRAFQSSGASGLWLKGGAIRADSQALATTGAVAWAVGSQDAHCISTGNVTLTITGSVEGERLQLEYVPGGGHNTLTMGAGIVIPATTYTQAALNTAIAAGGTVRVILNFVNKRGVVYLYDFHEYNS